MPPADPVLSLTERLLQLASTRQAVTDLQRYFGIGSATDSPPYTGSHFEHLGGGGDRAESAHTVTPEDLIAVQTLSVQVPVRVALDLLQGSLGEQVSTLLRDIPADLDLAHADPCHVQQGSPADQAWHLLYRQPHVGWVTAGKLLAHKRPRLLPVYDHVVRCALGRPASWWISLHAALQAHDQALHHRLLNLRGAAAVPTSVSALRICDVVVWMGHCDSHRNAHCTGLAMP
ncbi:DUF6308 family protein [Streptomyces milbemycinicus]|uniref:DUF6308 family protein n=1 Tax=Streptomyces milbemycinicus TaxID=476552 RepID=A0ABW8M312_9ACTN